jgi:ppGpp synthetase/RelA/SpoT-type nucleotidyltranferase
MPYMAIEKHQTNMWLMSSHSMGSANNGRLESQLIQEIDRSAEYALAIADNMLSNIHQQNK